MDKDNKSALKLNSIPQEKSAGVVCESTDPLQGKTSVRFRKGKKNEKDLFIEVWKDDMGFVSSLKISDKVTTVYNDFEFGGIAWSRDSQKVVFVGEVPEVASYKAYFKDPEEEKKDDEKKDEKKKEEGKKEDEKKEDKKEEHWQDEKYLYQENFGETHDTQKVPGIFVFDLAENSLNQV